MQIINISQICLIQLMPLSTFNPAARKERIRKHNLVFPQHQHQTRPCQCHCIIRKFTVQIQTTKIASEYLGLQYQKQKSKSILKSAICITIAQTMHHQLAFVDSNLISAETSKKICNCSIDNLLAIGTDVSKVKLQVPWINHSKDINSKYQQVLNALKFAIGISIEQKLQIESNIQYQNINECRTSSTLDIRITKLRTDCCQ
ncbi:MAG: hypothetical protein IPO85_10710 [Saprospiraceae bacterium]|uniref:Uncharacterized protein n=1 Tax=Candidatus Defluviibacterium haderslevense TaxID=2981993 RepID=A0A9D7SA92_9BACT|nr:hypothetical protein [Candidatus Defluviibacterium haderslevense]